MTILINAAKKHQTEVRYCVKNIMVIKQDNDIRIPSKWVLLILEIKSGVIEAIRYIANAIRCNEFGKLSLYSI